MSEAHARSWWADVEHLREAAERRSTERAKARIEGRDPVALTPLRPLHAVEGLAALHEALEAVQPVAPGEVPHTRRFARDGARATAEPPRTGTLTLVRDDEVGEKARETDAAPLRFQRRGPGGGLTPRPPPPRLRAPGARGGGPPRRPAGGGRPPRRPPPPPTRSTPAAAPSRSAAPWSRCRSRWCPTRPTTWARRAAGRAAARASASPPART